MSDTTQTLRPHEMRVLEERRDLREKTDKLVAFLASDGIDAIPGTDLVLLRKQSRIMDEYLEVLDQRIARFTPN